MSQSIPKKPQSRFRTAVVIVGLVCLMILAQVLTRNYGSGSFAASAGTARGDIRVAREAIPTHVNGWKVLEFQEHDPGPQGWAHTWRMARDQREVLVSFDQVGFMGWHELTVCYQATGCTLADRKVMSGKRDPEADNWGYVQATLMRTLGEHEVLMYSIFNGLGEKVNPPGSAQPEKSNGLFDWLSRKDMRKLGTNRESGRCLQVQLLIPGGKEMSDEDHAALEQLHFQTREIFRQYWMKEKGNSK